MAHKYLDHLLFIPFYAQVFHFPTLNLQRKSNFRKKKKLRTIENKVFVLPLLLWHVAEAVQDLILEGYMSIFQTFYPVQSFEPLIFISLYTYQLKVILQAVENILVSLIIMYLNTTYLKKMNCCHQPLGMDLGRILGSRLVM